MTLLNRPISRDEQMDSNKVARSSPARTQGVILHTLGLVRVQDSMNFPELFWWNRPIEQPARRSRQQAVSSEHNVGCHQQRNDRIQSLVTGDPHQGDAYQNPSSGPYIGHQVFAIRFQGNRVMLPTSSQENQRHTQVDQ